MPIQLFSYDVIENCCSLLDFKSKLACTSTVAKILADSLCVASTVLSHSPRLISLAQVYNIPSWEDHIAYVWKNSQEYSSWLSFKTPIEAEGAVHQARQIGRGEWESTVEATHKES